MLTALPPPLAEEDTKGTSPRPCPSEVKPTAGPPKVGILWEMGPCKAGLLGILLLLSQTAGEELCSKCK